ncbi:MAG: pyridoxine 5'-phosphate synthase [Bacteroidetes bacterium]|nr:pyridoxine 5'-phosphate synthase [Bacteroidota bacterium]
MVQLSVNVNKVATLRNARGGQVPNVVEFALKAEQFGANGITVHPRPDQRHIRNSDVLELASAIRTEFNIEGYPSADYLDLLRRVRPAQATLVPDLPNVLTSNAGWNVVEHQQLLSDVVSELKSFGCRVSIFMDPNPKAMEAVARTGADRIELYTEAFAAQYPTNPAQAIKPYIEASKAAQAAGLGINAGHDLSLQNLGYLVQHLAGLQEVSIGHALVADCLDFGLKNTIGMYRRLCQPLTY